MESRIARSVSATQLVRDLGAIRSMAADGPVGITSHNRTELVMLSAQRFAEMAGTDNKQDPAVLDAKLTTVLDGIDTQVMILDRDLQVRRINRAMRLVFGVTREDVRGMNLTELLPTTASPFLMRRLREVAVSGKIAEFDFASQIRPGRTLHARMIPWPGGVIYIAEDITDRLSGIERESEFAAMRQAFSVLGGRGSGSIDEGGTILAADEGLCELIGAGREQIAGRRFVTLFDPAQRVSIEHAIGTNAKPHVIDASYLRRGVSIAHARLALAPFYAGDGRARHAFVIEDRASN